VIDKTYRIRLAVAFFVILFIAGAVIVRSANLMLFHSDRLENLLSIAPNGQDVDKF